MLRLLRVANYRAESFNSPILFLESLAERVPDCVVLDLQMPMMTGVELQQHLLQLAEPPPVIIITAHDEPKTRERCLALGAVRYLRKPIEGDIADRFDRGSRRRQAQSVPPHAQNEIQCFSAIRTPSHGTSGATARLAVRAAPMLSQGECLEAVMSVRYFTDFPTDDQGSMFCCAG